MPHAPVLTGKELLRALQKAGFVETRIKGSHHIIEHPDGRKTVIPLHAGETIGPGLLAQILRDCEMSREALKTLL